MKYLIIIVMALLSFKSNALEKDKVLHLVSSSVISSAIFIVTESKSKAFYGCMVVGAAKEVYDYYDYGEFSKGDLLADAIGCYAGIEITSFIIKPSKDGLYLEKTWEF